MAILIKNLGMVDDVVRTIPANRNLKVKDGTPLASIVNDCFRNVIPQEDKTSYIDDVIDLCAKDQSSEVVLDKLVQLGANAVSAQFKFIQNEVKGDIEEVYRWVEEEVGEALTLKPDIRICPSQLPSLFDHHLLAGAVDRYTTPTTTQLELGYGEYPAMSHADLIMVMCGGDKSLEAALAEVSNVNNVDIVDIYNKNFRMERMTDYPKSVEMVSPFYVSFDVIESAILFLIANGLNENPPEGVGLSLDRHRLAMAVMLNTGGYRLRNALMVRSRAIDNGLVYDTTTIVNGSSITDIVVYKENYDSWLENGGSVEVLVGLHLRRRLGNLPRITRHEYPNFEHIARHHHQNRETMLKSNRETAISLAVNIAMERKVREFDFSDYPFDVNEVTARRKQIVKDSPYADGMDVYEYVTKVVAQTFYHHYNAYRVIKSIIAHGKNNPDLSAREAAALAKSDLVLDFLFSQVKVC